MSAETDPFVPLPAAPQASLRQPCVRAWRCTVCGRQLLMRFMRRDPGPCSYCNRPTLRPAFDPPEADPTAAHLGAPPPPPALAL